MFGFEVDTKTPTQGYRRYMRHVGKLVEKYPKALRDAMEAERK